MKTRSRLVDRTNDLPSGDPASPITATGDTPPNNLTNEQTPATDVNSNRAQNPLEATEVPAAVELGAPVAPNGIDAASDRTQNPVKATEVPAAVEPEAPVAATATGVTPPNNTTNNAQETPTGTPVDGANALVAQNDNGAASDSDPTDKQTKTGGSSAPKVERTIKDLAEETYKKIDKGSFLNFVLTVFCFHWGHYKKLQALTDVMDMITDENNEEGKKAEKKAFQNALKIHRFPFFSCCRKEPRSFAEYNKNNNKDHEHTASMT